MLVAPDHKVEEARQKALLHEVLVAARVRHAVLVQCKDVVPRALGEVWLGRGPHPAASTPVGMLNLDAVRYGVVARRKRQNLAGLRPGPCIPSGMLESKRSVVSCLSKGRKARTAWAEGQACQPAS